MYCSNDHSMSSIYYTVRVVYVLHRHVVCFTTSEDKPGGSATVLANALQTLKASKLTGIENRNEKKIYDSNVI